MNDRLFEKLHKREFEKHYERLDSICRMAENKVETAIPAIKYQMEQGIRSKADAKELKKLGEDKASAVVVEELINRLNRLEEKVKFEIEDRA
jgi:predicted transcriptional regulator